MIWIDITNIPHVLLFKRIIRRFNVLLTVRKISFIEEILKLHGIKNYILIGSHGKSNEEKLRKSSERILKLIELVRDVKIGIAKHSVEFARISFGLGIKSYFIFDNEKALHIAKLTLPIVENVIMPEVIDEKRLPIFDSKVIKFKGICEVEHVRDFKPNKKILDEHQLNEHEYIVIRPPPYFSSYYKIMYKNKISEKIFKRIESLGYEVVYIPRGNERVKGFKTIKGIDSLSLIYYSKAFIGSGGTMNREASLLGKISIAISGETLAVNKYLENKGILFHVRSYNDIERIINRCDDDEIEHRAKNLLRELKSPIDLLEEILKKEISS